VCNNFGLCQPGCTSDANCTTSQAGTKCNTGTGRCQQCITSTDCNGVAGKPICDTGDRAGRCVGCLVNSDCGDGGTPFCRNSACVECRSRQDCPANNDCDNGTCVHN
jgi:hypothetical protein